MKKILLALFSILFILSNGCSDDSAGGGTDPFGGGGTGTGSVTFTVAIVQDNQQKLFFEFKPSTNVVLTQITANCAAAGVNNETVQGDGTTVYSSTNPIYIGPLTVTQSGQQWTFKIEGKIGTAQGQAYNKDVNFTVP